MAGSLRDSLATLETYTALDADARRALTEGLATALGSGFAPVLAPIGSLGLVGVTHEDTGLVFVAIPGGTFAMGLRAEEKDEIASLGAELGPKLLALHTGPAEPTHDVVVAPFLCAQIPVLEPLAHAFTRSWNPRVLRPEFTGNRTAVPWHVTPSEAHELLERLSMRLPSEAEWEFLAREGGSRSWIGAALKSVDADLAYDARSLATAPVYAADGPARYEGGSQRFGLWGLLFGEWVADGWHETYAGAPSDARAWDAATMPSVARGGGATMWPWQDGRAWVLCHAAMRHHARRDDTVWGLRFARDVPG